MQSLMYIMRWNPRTGGIKGKYDCIITNGHLLLYCSWTRYTQLMSLNALSLTCIATFTFHSRSAL